MNSYSASSLAATGMAALAVKVMMVITKFDNVQGGMEFSRNEGIRCYPSETLGQRRLDGEVIHYKKTSRLSGTVPRNEVVTAIQEVMDGEQNFLALTTLDGKMLFEALTPDRMVLSLSGDDYSQEFTVRNAFLKSDPNTMIDVRCPGKPPFEVCNFSEHLIADDGLVNCFDFEDSRLGDDFSSDCMDDVYDISLYALPGPHFSIVAKNLEIKQNNCPGHVAFVSSAGQKHRLHIVGDDIEGLPAHSLGTSSLRDILEAEDGADPISDSTYDLFENNCVHYAGRIWRGLGFEETHELANFLIRITVDDENVLNHAQKKIKLGGMRALRAFAIGGKSAFEKFIKELVYSRLLIQT